MGHTPGPWKVSKAKSPVDGEYDWAVGATIKGNTYCIAESFGRVDDEVRTPAEANARLMAAAPDLLDSLKELVYASSHCAADWPEEQMHALRMIAKAEGT